MKNVILEIQRVYDIFSLCEFCVFFCTKCSVLVKEVTVVSLPAASHSYGLENYALSFCEDKQDYCLHKTRCVFVPFFTSVTSVCLTEDTKNIAKASAHLKSEQRAKANVSILCFIIMTQSTVEVYLEGYTWARTSENVREDAK